MHYSVGNRNRKAIHAGKKGENKLHTPNESCYFTPKKEIKQQQKY